MGRPTAAAGGVGTCNASLASEAQVQCVLRLLQGKPEAHSQFAEDLLLLPTLLRLVCGRPGTFVEAGAFNGYTYSNTAVLETCFGWSGLLVEANPANFRALAANAR